MVSNQKAPGKRKAMVSEGHARKHGRTEHSSCSLCSGCLSGSGIALPHSGGQRLHPFPCLSPDGMDTATLLSADLVPLCCSGGEQGNSVAVMRIWLRPHHHPALLPWLPPSRASAEDLAQCFSREVWKI